MTTTDTLDGFVFTDSGEAVYIEAPVSATVESNPVGHDNGEGHTPVTFCHKGKALTTDDDGFLNGHLGHGDTLGPCPEPTPEPSPEPSNPVGPVETPLTETPVETPLAETPTVGGVPVTDLPVCTLEDGSAPDQVLPCYWDGGPNGTGETYTVVASEMSNPVGLAETGMNTGAGMGIALALLVAGVAAVRLARRNRVAA